MTRAGIGSRRLGLAIALQLSIVLQGEAVVTAELPVERLRQLDAYLVGESRRFQLPGFAVAVTSQGSIAHVSTYGEGIQRDSAFLMGSCSKTVTALAALLALEAAGVTIHSPVQDVLTSLQISGAPPQSLRIEHLLQHRSGLKRNQGFDALPSLEVLQRDGYTLRLHAPPGERFAYCNLNYSLLGLIIESLTGEPFVEYVEKQIFIPAGMRSSCGLAAAADVPLAPEYQYCFGFARHVPATQVPASRIPSGFLRCSAGDLARLQLLIAQDGRWGDEQVFPKSVIRRMKTPPWDSGFGYGMGLVRADHEFGPLLAHEGATSTGYAFHGYLEEDRRGVVLLVNINLFDPFTDHGEAIYENMLRIIQGQPAQRTYPLRIWVRWIFLGGVLLTVWQLMAFIRRWRRSGWQWQFPSSPRQRLAIAIQPLIPLALWIAILHWTQTPLLAVFDLEPDVMWAAAFLTVSGVFTACCKKCVDSQLLAGK